MTDSDTDPPRRHIPHRGIHAPHLVLADYPVEQIRELSAQVLDHQAQKWTEGKAGTITPYAPLPVIDLADGIGLPFQPSLLSSVHGKIERMLLAFPSASKDVDYLAGLYAQFIASFPEASFVILTHTSAEQSVLSIVSTARAESRCSVVIAPNYLDFTLWAEDPFEVVLDLATPEKNRILLKPYTFVRHGDDLVADLLSHTDQVPHTQVPIVFQGGNVLVGDTFVLVGSDYLAATATLVDPARTRDNVVFLPKGMTPLDFARHLFRRHVDATREFIYVGTKLPLPTATTVSDGSSKQLLFNAVGISQPIFHIDMFITLAGRTPEQKYRVLVGSPRMADDMLHRPNLPQALDNIFDDIAATLARHPELDVVRTPLPLEIAKQGDEWVWYYATTNNCIVEIVDDLHKRVWLPQYGYKAQQYLKLIDVYVAGLWNSWGFDVIGLGDFNQLAQGSGAANCMKKVLLRTPRNAAL